MNTKKMMWRLLVCVCVLLVLAEGAAKKKTARKRVKVKPAKDYDCTAEIRAAIIGWADAYHQSDWKTFAEYYDRELIYMKYDEPTYFGRKGALEGAKKLKTDVPDLKIDISVSEAFCTDQKTAVSILITQTFGRPDIYNRILIVWRNRKGRWRVIREAIVGNLGSSKSDQEFSDWGVQNAVFS